MNFYHYNVLFWWPLLDLNQRPIDYESTALTTELKGQNWNHKANYTLSVKHNHQIMRIYQTSIYPLVDASTRPIYLIHEVLMYTFFSLLFIDHSESNQTVVVVVPETRLELVQP